MKRLPLILCFLIANLCFSQTKKQLIDIIIKANTVESEHIGRAGAPSKQYQNFQKLKAKLSLKELTAFTKHKNPVIRTYSSWALIQDNTGNIPEILAYELQKQDSVTTFSGCIIDKEPIASIVYHKYWNKIRMEAYQKENGNQYKKELAMNTILSTNTTQEQLDSVIIYAQPKNTNWLLYNRVFTNRKHKESYLPQIEALTFQFNNAYALEYLNKQYPEKYTNSIKNYVTSVFPTAKFTTENEIFHLHTFVEMMLATNNAEYRQIVIKKLKKENAWKRHAGWFSNTLKKYNVSI